MSRRGRINRAMRTQREKLPNLRLSVKSAQKTKPSRRGRLKRAATTVSARPLRTRFEVRRIGRTASAQWRDAISRWEEVSDVPPSRLSEAWRFPAAVNVGEVRKKLDRCQQRSQRKQVLHALRLTGRGSAGGPRRPKGEPC